ncbi:MAG: aldo/keto reductase [Candidatus Omnitrophica bacterium]|nr:aldo/keto reductase [Candidatus Omnitrophota bacterium]
MEYRILGTTGLKVSAIGLGCAELGMDYGIKVPGQYGRPDRQTAIRILHQALDLGINLFDVAPGYGDSESLLGELPAARAFYVATKASVAGGDPAPARSIRASVHNSLKCLRRDCLDIVQVHNISGDMPEKADILLTLSALRKEGLIRFVGDSVYGPAGALAGVRTEAVDVLQLAYSILDQRMSREAIPAVIKSGKGVICRSAYFRGMLTDKIDYLDDSWLFLKQAVKDIKERTGAATWDELSGMALRFCLSTAGISSVLVGVRVMEELEFAVAAESRGRLPEDIFQTLLGMGIKDDYWVEPLNWYLKL